LRTLKNRRVVRDPGWKRAIVTVKAGERIESVS
jgi:ribosomal protein L23